MITSDVPGEVERLRDGLNRRVQENLPAEKARAREEQTRIAQKLRAEGSRYINGIGQKIGSIDMRTAMRLHRENPGCLSDPGFRDQLLRDSPKLCAPGYVPRKHYSPTWSKSYK